MAQLTQIAEATPTQPPAPPTESAPTDTPVVPSPTPEPTNTQPPPTPTPRPCDWVEFVRDVSVNDGDAFQPEAAFTKTWRLKNIGTCTWTPDYDLVFVGGDRMDGQTVISLDQNVRPGEIVDISVDLVAPSDPGDYLSRWQLRDADGKLFGIGDDQDQPFWVSIKVVRTVKLVWDLTQDFCLATWSSSALDGLACPDPSENMDIGFVNRYPNPVLENLTTENEPALVTFPNRGDKGFIQGIFPAYRVKKGDHFRTVTGCLYESYECYVTYQLSYRINGGKVKNLEQWRERYDGKIHKIDVDLSDLAGRDVELILTVLNNGSSNDDWAFWLLPSIWR